MARSTKGIVPVEGFVGRTKLFLVGLILATAMAAVSANAAEASYSYGYGDEGSYGYADSDGYVPIYSVCYAGNEVGSYDWYFDGYAVYGTIYINDCALARLGAGPNDRERVVEHELGHSMGLPHSSNPYDVMYPELTVTGT